MAGREEEGDVPIDAQLWLIGGPNGAGKTTLARNVLQGLGLPATTSILNPDAITRAIDQVLPRRLTWLLSRVPVYGAKGVNWAGVVAVEAVVHACIEEATDVCAETVLSTDKYLKHVERARERGLKTGLIFVALKNPDEHIARVKARVEAGGHDVPEDKIRSRWEGAHRQLTTFAARVDHLLVFANERLGEPPGVAWQEIEGMALSFWRRSASRTCAGCRARKLCPTAGCWSSSMTRKTTLSTAVQDRAAGRV